jgi:hypothetical protein
MKSKRVLFICKRREDYSQHESYSHSGVSTGLLNSARFVKDMLLKNGICSELAIVQDNNSIDKVVTEFRPTHVIIEALWVVPEKFEVLTKLHPNVKWIIRFHSEVPFVATEGIAMNWLFRFVEHPNVSVSGNSDVIQEELEFLIGHHFGWPSHKVKEKVIFLPNYYDISSPLPIKKYDSSKDYVSVGCFGAVRPLKNQLLQAVAALKFVRRIGKKLHFHINGNRIEGNGDPILKNLRELFVRLGVNGHKLIEHPWMPHEQFMKLISSKIDIGLQVNFSETFNIIAADMVTAGVPIVTGNEVKWAAPMFNASPNDSDDISCKMRIVWAMKPVNVTVERFYLKSFVNQSERIWLKYLNK